MKRKKIQAKALVLLTLAGLILPLLIVACSPTDNPASPFAEFTQPVGTPTCTQPEGWAGLDQWDDQRDFKAGTMGFTKVRLDNWALVTEFDAQICAGLGPALQASAVEPGSMKVVVGLYSDLEGKPYQLIAKSDPIDFFGYCGEGFNFHYYGSKGGPDLYVKPGTYWIALGNQQGQGGVAAYTGGGQGSWTSDCFFPKVLTSNCLKAAPPLTLRAFWICYGGGQG